MTNWFETSKDGLAKQAKEHGAAKIFLELISNALDERESGVTEIAVRVTPIAGQDLADVAVEDNSSVGFRELNHAYTLFANSYKRDNPELRGRFNFGEKMFLALCQRASIATTTGTVVFDGRGRREHPARRRDRGTIIEARYEITPLECDELERLVRSLLLPDDVTLTFNGQPIPPTAPLHSFRATLPTLNGDVQGVLRPTRRETTLRVFEPRDGELPHLYELGIPVVETDIRWHVSVGQKVPLNKDRDNVTPAYHRKLCTVVGEAMQDRLEQEDATTWAGEALADADASQELVNRILDERFGEHRVVFDPSDTEANMKAMDQGATVIHGRMLSKSQWENVRKHGAALPAGQVYPTPKPYSDDPQADPQEIVQPADWSAGMGRVVEYAKWMGQELMGVDVAVTFVKDLRENCEACYGRRGPQRGVLDFSVKQLGRRWFDTISQHTDALLLHEFGHHFAGSHYSTEYYDALCELGAKLKQLALDKPKAFCGSEPR